MTFSTMLTTMADGMLKTGAIFILTLVGSLPLGMVVALLRKSRFAAVRGIISVYISVMRGTPLMLQLLAWYFGPYYLFGWNIGSWRFPALIVGFVLNYAAYFAEIYRGGILSIDPGQHEAAKALGLSRAQTFFRIVLPQTVKRVIPAVGNEVITLVKDTSLAFTIAVTEMFTIAKQLSSANTTMTPLIAAAVFYYIFNYLVAFAMGQLEKRYAYYA